MSVWSLAASVAVGSAEVHADPPVPRGAPEFALDSTTGSTRRLRDFQGRVLVIVYEDRDASNQNDALKQELARRARQTNLTEQVSLLPVADLHSYAFWPAQGFARDAVRDIAVRLGVEIAIDWDGAMASAYRMGSGRSNVLVIGRDRQVVYHHAGALDATERTRFFQVLSEAIGPSPAP